MEKGIWKSRCSERRQEIHTRNMIPQLNCNLHTTYSATYCQEKTSRAYVCSGNNLMQTAKVWASTSSSVKFAWGSPVRYAKFESIRYFIDIDILQNCLINIDIFGIALSISISISIFSKMTISILISISIFFKSGDISTIDISDRYIEQS